MWCPIRPVAWSAIDEADHALRCPAAGRDPSTRWLTRTTSPTPIRRGPAATRCASGDWPATVTPSFVRPALGLLGVVPGPVAGRGAHRTRHR